MISTATEADYLERIGARFGMGMARTIRLYRLAGGRRDDDGRASMALVERVLSRTHSDLDAGLDMLRCAPANVIANRGDGRDIKITLPSHTDTGTTRWDRGVEHRDAMSGGYDVGIKTGLQWDHRPGQIGSIVGTKTTVTGDQVVWARLDDGHPQIIERAIYGELSGSPAVSTLAPHRWGERGGQLVRQFVSMVPVVEISLLPLGNGALPVAVELGAAPEFEAEERASLNELYRRGQLVW